MYDIQLSTTAWPLVFYMVDSADHFSAKTGLSPTVTIRKVGGSFATPGGAVTEIANGWYQVAGNATDSGTLGPLLLHATSAGADPCDICYRVVSYNPQDSVRLGLTALPNAAANAAGGLPISIAGALDLDEMNVDIEAIQTSTAGLTYTVANQVDANVVDWKGATAPAMTGDAFARLGAPAGASIAADLAEIEAETDLIGADSAGVTTLLTRIPGTVQPQTGDAYARLGAPAGASIAADLAEIEGETDALLAGVIVTTNNDKTGYSLNLAQTLSAPAATNGTQAHTLGEALNAARAQGFGKWALVGTTLSLYAPDGTTLWRAFALDSATVPTSRT